MDIEWTLRALEAKYWTLHHKRAEIDAEYNIRKKTVDATIERLGVEWGNHHVRDAVITAGTCDLKAKREDNLRQTEEILDRAAELVIAALHGITI